jgi:tRNA1(Val) A37 N6-methylase TrmN6
MDAAVTEDTLLDGRVRLLQPVQGYRAAIDPVFLAATVHAGAGEFVLDAGCGAGAASLCLAARVPDCRIAGLDTDETALALVRRNIALNKLEGRVEAVAGNIAAPPPRLAPASFHHVMTNPPHRTGEGTPPADPGRAAAHLEGEVDLDHWMRACIALLRPRGTLCVVHRADRLDALLAALAGRVGGIAVFPLWPMRDRAAKRVLVRARKGVAGPVSLLPGLVLHEADGRSTPGAEAVLRGAAALEF